MTQAHNIMGFVLFFFNHATRKSFEKSIRHFWYSEFQYKKLLNVYIYVTVTIREEMSIVNLSCIYNS